MDTLSSIKVQVQRGFQSTWGLWLAIAIMAPVGLGAWAVLALTRLPAPMNCNTSTASDSSSARFYCAQTVAQEGSVDNLQQAIQMMTRVSKNHPLRPEGDRLIEQWSQKILAIADTEFQNGDLDEAISIARKIPGRAPTSKLAKDTIEEWETIWNDAEDIYEDAARSLREERWRAALAEARALVRVENRYWSSTRYMELLNDIQMQKESSELAAKQEAERKARQRERSEVRSADDMLSEWEEERAVEDETRLSRARSFASAGTVDGLENAISEARGVIWGTDQYEEAQALIQDWQYQVEQLEDQPYLDRAEALANQGDIDSLRAAIQEAQQIPSYRTLYSEAQANIEAWTSEIEQITLEQASPPPSPKPARHDSEFDSEPADAIPEPPSADELFNLDTLESEE